MKILFILTSHGQLGDSGKRTGFWLEEFAAPYYVFRDAGADIVLATPRGGMPPIDPNSETADYQTEYTRRLSDDTEATTRLRATAKLSTVTSTSGFDAIFVPGGHGPLWDLSTDADSIRILEEAVKDGIPIGTVCHGPAALKNVKTTDGRPMVQGQSVAGFSNSEEDAFGTAGIVPFRIEDMLKENGGNYSSVPDWQPHVVQNEKLVMGQNPASSREAGERLLRLVESHQPANQ